MSDHFRLRKSSEVSVITAQNVDTGVRVAHLVSVMAVFAAVLGIAASLVGTIERSRYTWDQQNAAAKPNEKKATATYDKYGGFKKIRGEAKGYFSLQITADGQWTFVTPEGNAFFASIVNKMHPGNGIPEVYDEKYGGSDTKWAKEAASFVDSLHMNTIGNSSNLAALRQFSVLRLPFTVSADFVEWENGDRFATKDYPDVWDETVIAEWDEEAKEIADMYGSDKYLAWIWVGNEWNFNLRRADGSTNPTAIWWRELVAAEGVTPAKEQWVSIYKKRYSDIAALNDVYGTDYASFDDLYAAGLSLYDRFETVGEDEVEDAEKSFGDILDYNTEVGKQAHKVAYEALKKYLPNTPVSSERMVQGTVDDLYLEKIRDYIDFLSANFYMQVEQVAPSKVTLDHYYDMVQKPIMISEHTFAGPGCGANWDGGHYPEADSQEGRATAHLAYQNNVVEHKYILGLGWHEYQDVKYLESECGVTNFGLVDRSFNVYQEMIDAGETGWNNYDKERWDIDPNVSGSESKLKSPSPIHGGVKQGANRPTAVIPDLAAPEVVNFFVEAIDNPSLIDKDDIIFGPNIQ